MRKHLAGIVLLFCVLSTFAQMGNVDQIGIHQLQSLQYRSIGDSLLKLQTPFLTTPSPLLITKTLQLSRTVFGWHPYWASVTAYQNYDYDVLTHIGYFSYETDTLTGGYKTINGWDQTPIIDYAHQRGVKVILTVTNFGTAANNVILKDTVRQNKMLQTLIQLLKSRNGDGINFDLESVSVTQRANLVSFISRAVKKVKAELPNAEISMATPAVDWSGSWDLAALGGLCDYLIIMAYNYYYSGSVTAGPVAPLEGESQNITKSTDTYLSAGVPAKKLMIGLPWYGYNWPVSSTARKATATAAGVAATYAATENLSKTYTKVFDQTTKVPWMSYTLSNVIHQVWFDDLMSYGYKYDLVNARDLAGIGIWALSYENGDPAIWNGIKASFFTTGIGELPLTPKDQGEFTVYPNPVSGVLNASLSLSERQGCELRILDLDGRTLNILLNKELAADNYLFSFDLSGYGDGIYFLVLKTKKQTLTRKIIIQNR